MFVADQDDLKVYAYKMSDTTRDSAKDITLTSANGQPRGVWCDGDTVWVANDGSASGNKIFAYQRSDGSHDSAKDMESLYVSTAAGSDNATQPRGLWSDGATMFVADSEDDKVYAFKMSDESRDFEKNILLHPDNDEARGLWFDGRLLWVIDDADDRFYLYDLPGAQPTNTPATGLPAVRTLTSEDVWTATLTAGSNVVGVGYITELDPDVGSLSPGATFTVDAVTYTVINLHNRPSGALHLYLDQALPREFTISVAGESFSSASTARTAFSAPIGYRYSWDDANLSWSASDSISVVLSVDSVPEAGVELTAHVSGITDPTDGLANAFFHYQWIRVDGTTETELDGETGSTYTPTADDVDKHLKVRVIFDDDAGNKEYPRTSHQVGPVLENLPPAVSATAAPVRSSGAAR